MCDLALVARARTAADDIVHGYLRLPLRKALRIDTPQAFDRFVAVLAAELRARTQEPVKEAVEATLRILDVDLRAIPEQRRETLLRQAVDAAKAALRPVTRQVGAALAVAAPNIANATRTVARESGLAVGAMLSAFDKRMVTHVARSHTLYVQDAFGRRADKFEQKARDVVANGLRDGLGRDDITQDLAAAASQAFLGRGGNYWEVVAAALVGQGRSYAQVSSYAEACIKAYRIESVLDERTSDVCRFMHGRVFEVSTAVRQLESIKILSKPEMIKSKNPWLRSQAGAIFVESDKGRITLAHVVRSGIGTADDRGEYWHEQTNNVLAGFGLSLPPYHCLCRTNTSALD